ncbi:MAG: hypothetical protein JO026_03755, partial [Patescibacteria group bacterium]|nr:hypothetical protein [Patescibacteria group bacterium]
MRELKIPRGLIVFLGVMLILTMIAFAFRAISERVSTGSAPSGTHLFSALFPFGNPSIPPQTASTSDTTANLEGAKASGGVPALRHVSQLPVSGGWFVPGKTATSAPLIRYMDRQSGHVEEVPADSFTETRLSNTTLPGMEELYAI